MPDDFGNADREVRKRIEEERSRRLNKVLDAVKIVPLQCEYCGTTQLVGPPQCENCGAPLLKRKVPQKPQVAPVKLSKW